MKKPLTLIRWIVGLLFIFSGLVKANDPLGLSYKMQEFFEAWGLHGFHDYTLAFALVMNCFEILAGVAVIIGWQRRLFAWLLLLLIVFFTFLTGYALLSGKIKTCGCFGDCLPLTPLQSFLKDIFLLVLIMVLLVNARRPQSAVAPTAAVSALLITVLLSAGLQFYVLRYLPVVDCLPYKKGNDLVQQMQVPEGAVSDSFAIRFRYRKNGKIVEFDNTAFPDDFDSTYEFVDRYDKLVRKGNAVPPITDLAFTTPAGEDTTAAIWQTPSYILVWILSFEDVEDWKPAFDAVSRAAAQRSLPVLAVTADAGRAGQILPGARVVSCDATVIKTAARVNPTFYLMNRSRVVEKASYASADAIVKRMNQR